MARLTKETELKDSEPSTTAAAASVITEPGGPAFPGDLRSSSGLGLGDGLRTHTAKWLQVLLRSNSYHCNQGLCTCLSRYSWLPRRQMGSTEEITRAHTSI